jgi:hypothetical protein
MRSAEKLVSQEDMWKVLEKHGGTRPKEVQTPKAELRKPLPTLEWETAVRTGPNSGFALSKCGRYSVSMDSVMGKAMYTAWRRSTPTTPEHMIGIRDKPQEAKVLCEKDR